MSINLYIDLSHDYIKSSPNHSIEKSSIHYPHSTDIVITTLSALGRCGYISWNYVFVKLLWWGYVLYQMTKSYNYIITVMWFYYLIILV